MSIEYFGTPSPALTVPLIEVVMDSISEITGINIVRRDDSAVGIGFTENENPEQETATIVVKPEDIYIGFHACHAEQRKKVLAFLMTKLAEVGCICKLDEE